VSGGAPTDLPRVLLSAYSCDPAAGSELTVGWHRTVEAARHARVWTLTEARGQQARIAAALAVRGLADRVTMVYVPHSAAERALMCVPGLFYGAYAGWQRRALREARRLHATVGFDLAHHVNLVGFRQPGHLGALGVPWVLGPVGGTQNYPPAFLWRAGWRNGLAEALRTVANGLQLRYGRFRRAAARADALLAATTTAARDLHAALGLRADVLLETGIEHVHAPRRWAERPPGPLRVLWVGETSFRKGIDLMAAAHRRLRAEGVPVHLTVVGDGPMRGAVPTDDPAVEATGWLPYDDVPAAYLRADVFVFTSLRDTSGNVVLEAMAHGLPVVYLDHQGVADMASPDCGVPVRVGAPDQAVRDLAAALAALAADPARYDALSAGAVERARRFLWRRNGAAMQAVYARVLGRDAPAVADVPVQVPDRAVATV
jgi:glycosyltransferase involved in cell wall biosynthesis